MRNPAKFGETHFKGNFCQTLSGGILKPFKYPPLEVMVLTLIFYYLAKKNG